MGDVSEASNVKADSKTCDNDKDSVKGLARKISAPGVDIGMEGSIRTLRSIGSYSAADLSNEFHELTERIQLKREQDMAIFQQFSDDMRSKVALFIVKFAPLLSHFCFVIADRKIDISHGKGFT